MISPCFYLISVAFVAIHAGAAPQVGPFVQLDNAIVTGLSAGGVDQFLGIPYAKPPKGNLRFQLPQLNSPYTGSILATAFGPSCPQQSLSFPVKSSLPQQAASFIASSIWGAVFPEDEDCLTINVITPTISTPLSKLPVIVWIYGGGFEIGSSSYYNGATIVEQSIALGMPAIYVSMNYRVSAFGFLGGKEVKQAGVGNLGLQDQRLALKWIQKYIGAFGGDPTKVMIWGESAGAISVALHMLSNGGNTGGLFRAAFMESGAPLPVGDITKGQPFYDSIVGKTGCSGSADTLACLRTVPYSNLKEAIDQISSENQVLNAAWLPRADGVFLADNPQQLVLKGSVANIPFVTGNCDDEGTIFSLTSLNVTTDAGFRDYMQSTYLTGSATAADLDQLSSLYPNDITQGSPYNTGAFNALTPQFKRISAFQGDALLQAPRRFFLQQRAGKQSVWAFLSQRDKALPIFGAAHTTDLLNSFGGGDLANYLIRFAATLNPNGGLDLTWPKYTTSSPQLLTFLDGPILQTVTQDTYRTAGMNYLINFMLAHPL